jgi:hypothetical protein
MTCRIVALGVLASMGGWGATLDLRRAVVVVRGGVVPEAEKTAAAVLVEEVEKRSGVRLPVATARRAGAVSIVVTGNGGGAAEGYRLSAAEGGTEVRIEGNDARGALYGVGALLRRLEWGKGRLDLPVPVEEVTRPASRIRGHQLGYRDTANSWDAWTPAQFEQYIRELAFFGINSVENIPSQDEKRNPLMKVSRREMNRAMSEICRRYGLDYWVWTPADFDLRNDTLRAERLAAFDQMAADCATLTGVFVPGGDPGSNPPELLMPWLEEIAAKARARHPAARVWVSLQGFHGEKAEYVYRSIETRRPEWLGGLVHGPSSPPMEETRRRLAAGYGLRMYPDITHNKICQYQVPEWDQAYALTLGREASNPRPAEYAGIHNWWAAASDGFISYSDGVHDDVNKTIWSALGWDPSRDVRGILIEYARVHFGPDVAAEAADAILALERNWRGPLAENGSVEGTLATWQGLEKRAPQLAGNWRWQLCLLRANYDAFVRRRLRHETALEKRANAVLLEAGRRGSEKAMSEAAGILEEAVRAQAAPELKARIAALCEALFQSVGLQTSVEKYHASGAERGAVLDFVDYPLNNRWWLEDELAKVRAMTGEEEKTRRLRELATWADPGPGSYYDDIGNEAASPRASGDAELEHNESGRPEPMFWWWENGKSRARLSWQTTIWPERAVYEGLDPAGAYIVRSTGQGQALLRINGQRVEPYLDGRKMGEFKEFRVPAAELKDRRLVLTWDVPADEGHLNWRQRSRLAEVWLIKQK